jgi:hypothetical protein
MVATLAIPRFDNGRTSRWPRPLPTVDLEREPLIERPRLTYGLEERELERLRAEATRDTVRADGDQPPESGRKLPRTRRKSRQRNRNLQRENWEDAE